MLRPRVDAPGSLIWGYLRAGWGEGGTEPCPCPGWGEEPGSLSLGGDPGVPGRMLDSTIIWSSSARSCWLAAAILRMDCAPMLFELRGVNKHERTQGQQTESLAMPHPDPWESP